MEIAARVLRAAFAAIVLKHLIEGGTDQAGRWVRFVVGGVTPAEPVPEFESGPRTRCTIDPITGQEICERFNPDFDTPGDNGNQLGIDPNNPRPQKGSVFNPNPLTEV